MKLLLLAAAMLALGGCVAPGYYVQPDHAGGYYGSGYYEGSGYYPDYYDGCCGSAGLSIDYGYGYGYPGYYGWDNYPYYGGYYGSYYYGHGGHHRHGHHDHDGHHDGHWDGRHWDGDHHGRHHDDHWQGGHTDGAVERWPSARQWQDPDRAPVPRRDAFAAPRWSAPRPQVTAPEVTEHFTPRTTAHSQPGASGRGPAPARSWTPRRSDTAPKKF